jgi:ribosome-associated translation inhibitor RaiA
MNDQQMNDIKQYINDRLTNLENDIKQYIDGDLSQTEQRLEAKIEEFRAETQVGFNSTINAVSQINTKVDGLVQH